jgi:uncharacterized protein YeaO (DUF488 family)
MLKIKRVYEEPNKNDGFRILVDRLWLRGLSKQQVAVDLWFKDIAPSNELRVWFSHDPTKWAEFQKKYKTELKEKSDSIDEIRHIIKEKKSVTLVYGAKDTEYNNAVVLLDLLNKNK